MAKIYWLFFWVDDLLTGEFGKTWTEENAPSLPCDALMETGLAQEPSEARADLGLGPLGPRPWPINTSYPHVVPPPQTLGPATKGLKYLLLPARPHGSSLAPSGRPPAAGRPDMRRLDLLGSSSPSLSPPVRRSAHPHPRAAWPWPICALGAGGSTTPLRATSTATGTARAQGAQGGSSRAAASSQQPHHPSAIAQVRGWPVALPQSV